MPAFLFAVFTSAFLLFLVQPIAARHILPWFGGTPAVWTACMLCFQAGLLIGYTYAHLLATYLKRKQQVIVHLSLLALSLLTLPIVPSESLKPEGGADPVKGIVILIFATVGLPYILISASGPLLQHWFSESGLGKSASSPYRLYAMSNVGSLLGLLSYPFLIEPALGLRQQSWIWSGGHVIYFLGAIACGMLMLRAARSKAEADAKSKESAGAESASAAPPQPPTLGDRLFWVAASATGCALLLAMTNQICQDVAVVPFLWILPLSLYLLTFIIAFDHDRWYFRPVWMTLAFLLVGGYFKWTVPGNPDATPAIAEKVTQFGGVVYLLLHELSTGDLPMVWQVVIYASAMFVCCMVCHGEMVRRKPAPKYLTGFYLSVALGGVIGGLFVSVLAPRFFSGFFELHLALAVTALLALSSLLNQAFESRWPKWSTWPVFVVWLAGSATLAWFLSEHIKEHNQGVLAHKRGFYGVLRVTENTDGDGNPYRSLYHGRIIHGAQYLDDSRRLSPTTYYSDLSGPGLALRYHHKRRAPSSSVTITVVGEPPGDPETGKPVHIGVIGLGVGTMAAHAKKGDRVRFYEINPQVEEMAREHFTFLGDGAGEATVVIGDARISLEQEIARGESQQFDLLVVDAFSGDSIPIHLLTREAFQLYEKHLAPGGVLAVHITNRYLELSDVARVLAREIKRDAVLVAVPTEDNLNYVSDWVLVTDNRSLIGHLNEGSLITEWETNPKEILWTDDYSNLLQVFSE
jgi:hypothetical protein